MKVVIVVDSINELKNKINMIKGHFGDNILYVVKAQINSLFETFGFTANAIYHKNLAKVMHVLLARDSVEDTLIYYTSLHLTELFLNKFSAKTVNRNKVVNVCPTYNTFEEAHNSIYNIYVNSVFKIKDSMISPKLQFLPKQFVNELIETHIANRLFELNPEITDTIYIENKEIKKTLKPKKQFNKNFLIPIIIALIATIGLFMLIAFDKMNYLLVLLFVVIYSLDLFVSLIYKYKEEFDSRFLK